MRRLPWEYLKLNYLYLYNAMIIILWASEQTMLVTLARWTFWLFEKRIFAIACRLWGLNPALSTSSAQNDAFKSRDIQLRSRQRIDESIRRLWRGFRIVAKWTLAMKFISTPFQIPASSWPVTWTISKVWPGFWQMGRRLDQVINGEYQVSRICHRSWHMRIMTHDTSWHMRITNICLNDFRCAIIVNSCKWTRLFWSEGNSSQRSKWKQTR